MRIALVSPYDLDRPGGVQNHVAELAGQLERRGHVTGVFAPGTTGTLGRSITVNVNGSQAPIGVALSAVRRTRNSVRAFRPDVVHVHEPGVPLVGWAAVGSDPQAATVATCHAYADTVRLLPVLTPIGRRIAGRITRFIAVSDAAANFHSRALDVPKKSFTVIGNGIDLARFTPGALRADQDVAQAPRIGYLGRLEHRKGVDVLLDAFVSLHDDWPDATLTIVGDGPERDALHQRIPERHRHAVTFTGRASDAQRQQALHGMDVLVAPARGGESFGIVLLEGLAAGVTLVASDIPGYRSVLRDGMDGWLTPPEDSAALARTLREVVSDHPQRHTRRANGAARAHTFGWQHVADRIEQVYKDADAAHKRAR